MRVWPGCWRRKCDCFAWFGLDWGVQCCVGMGWNGMEQVEGRHRTGGVWGGGKDLLARFCFAPLLALM